MVKTTKGLRWIKLGLGDYEVLYSPIDIRDEVLPNCDKNGRIVIVKETREYNKTYADDGKEFIGEMFKLKDGKVIGKTKRTNDVEQKEIVEVDTAQYFDLKDEHEYYVKANDKLIELLKTKNVALKYPFNSGFGYKPSVAILSFDVVGRLTMRVGRVFRSTISDNIENYNFTKDKANKQLDKLKGKDDSGVEQIKAEMI
jgi:hypothetical protein